MEQNLRNDIIWLATGQNRQHFAPVMCLEEQLNLPLNPNGFLGMNRADNDQIIGIFQRFIDVIIEIAGDGQFFLVPEKPRDFSVLFADAFGNLKTLQSAMDLGSDPDIVRVMSIGNECIVMNVHLRASHCFRNVTQGLSE